MKVIATKQGYFGKLRAVGNEFEVPEGSKASWFQPVEQKASGKGGKEPKSQATEKPADDLV
jgi:hypothetical protein